MNRSLEAKLREMSKHKLGCVEKTLIAFTFLRWYLKLTEILYTLDLLHSDPVLGCHCEIKYWS